MNLGDLVILSGDKLTTKLYGIVAQINHENDFCDVCVRWTHGGIFWYHHNSLEVIERAQNEAP
jgi:hypothetical protein